MTHACLPACLINGLIDWARTGELWMLVQGMVLSKRRGKLCTHLQGFTVLLTVDRRFQQWMM